MQKHIGWLLWLMMSLACSASEIVAWKVPLELFASAGLKSQGVVRMKFAPEASPFFKEGDELWDLKGIPAVDRSQEGLPQLENTHAIVTDPPMEWVVWNASTQRLVTKADWNAIFQLHQQFRIDQMPKQIRLTAEIFEVPQNGAPPSEKSMPSTTLTWVTRSGYKFEASNEADSTRINAAGEAICEDSFIDLNLHASCSMLNHPSLDFDCALILRSGVPCWVARDFNGTRGLDCRISGRIELVDGTPLDETVLIQKLQSSEPLKRDYSEPMRHRIGDKHWLVTAWLDPAGIANFTTSNSDLTEEVDPFADNPPEVIRDALKLQEIKVPDCLKVWFPWSVWELKEQIKRAGIRVKDSDFAGYAPLPQRIFLYTDDEAEMDKFESLFTLGCIRSPKQIVIGVEGNGESRLVTRSGCKGEMTLTSKDGVMRSIKIEPTIDETGELVDLRLDYLDQPDSVRQQSINSSLTLRSGKPTEIMRATGNDADSKPFRVEAEIVEVPR